MKAVNIFKNMFPDPSRHPSAWDKKPIEELAWVEPEEEEDSYDST
jgi:hypothetical protein